MSSHLRNATYRLSRMTDTKLFVQGQSFFIFIIIFISIFIFIIFIFIFIFSSVFIFYSFYLYLFVCYDLYLFVFIYLFLFYYSFIYFLLINAYLRVELIINFFMARTDVISKLRWDESLKLGEHQDFFLRAKTKGVRVVSCRNVKVQHLQRPPDPEYKRKRMREFQYLQQFLKKHNLASMELFTGITYVRNSAVNMARPVTVNLSWQ